MTKKKQVQINNDFWYVVVPSSCLIPFRDLQKALDMAKDSMLSEDETEPFQVLKVTQSWVVEVPEPPEPTVVEECPEDMWFYDDLAD